MVIGNLATAKRVAILVPGSDTTLATFFSRGSSSPGGGALALAAEAHRLDPGDTAGDHRLARLSRPGDAQPGRTDLG